MNKARLTFKIKTEDITDFLKSAIHPYRQRHQIQLDGTSLPDLLVIELGNGCERDIAWIKTILEKKPELEIFIIAGTSDPEILVEILQLGPKKFFTVPLDKNAVETALRHFFERFEKLQKTEIRPKGKIFSVMGSKGGVGTTTFAVNLAVSLAQRDEKPSVALLDLNIGFGEVPMFLDITPRHHWGDITENIDRLDETLLENILSAHKSGVRILPSPGYFEKHQPPDVSVMESLLNLMLYHYDYILIDIGQSINDTTLEILKLSDLVQIIAIQSLPCLSNTNRIVQSIIDYGYIEKDNVHVILNRYLKNSVVTRESVEEGIGRKLSWTIPNDYSNTMAAINSGTPLSSIAPRSKIVQAFRDYAAWLVQGDVKKESFFNKYLRFPRKNK